jgi:hypothetical protein
VTALYIVQNIQSYIDGNLTGSIVALIFLLLGITAATLLFVFTKEKSTTIYLMCSIGLMIYAAGLFTHKSVADYSLIIPFIILSLMTFNLKFIGIFGITSLGIVVVNIIGKNNLLGIRDLQSSLNVIFFILLIEVTMFGMAGITAGFILTSKKLQEQSLEH